MTQEQKAKRYDEAIERANKLQETCDSTAVVGWCEYIFPELKESEDEESKKWILEYLYDGMRMSDEQFKGQFKSAISWLEKQGSQKLANSAKTCKNEQKPTWSEEDERNLQGIIDEIKANKNQSPDCDLATYDRLLFWLNSLKDRYAWKPSDEQMDALQYIYRNLNPPLSDKLGWSSIRTLELLYNDLKKLREKQ